MRKIPLLARDGRVRAYATVENADFEWLNQWRWHAVDIEGKLYAQREERHPRRRQVYMHIQIMGAKHIDHINGEGLDNRRVNLRRATVAENGQNRRGPQANSTSGYRGVTWDKARKKWLAQAGLNGKRYYLGRFVDPVEAARAAADFRREHMPFSADARAA